MSNLTEVQGRLFFTAARVEPRDGTDVWMADGTEVVEFDINKSGTSRPSQLVEQGGALFLFATDDGVEYVIYRVDPQFRYTEARGQAWPLDANPQDLTATAHGLFYTVTHQGKRIVMGRTDFAGYFYGEPRTGTLVGDVGAAFVETRGPEGTWVFRMPGWPDHFWDYNDWTLPVAKVSETDGVEDRHYLAVGERVYYVARGYVMAAGGGNGPEIVAGPFEPGSKVHGIQHFDGSIFIEVEQPSFGRNLWVAAGLDRVTTVTMETSSSVVKMGESATITAIVPSATGPAWGDVMLLRGHEFVDVQRIDEQGRATFTFVPTIDRTFEFRAVYRGGHIYAPSVSAAPVTVTAVRRAVSLTASVSATQVNAGETIVLTRRVTADVLPSLPPRNRIVVMEGRDEIATTASVAIETASVELLLPPGVHRLFVRYKGTTHYERADSEVIEVEVIGVPMRVEASVKGLVRDGVAHAGREVVLKATVGREDGADGYLWGHVDFYDTVTDELLGTVHVASESKGVARLVVNLPRGAHRIIAVYRGGDGITSGSQSDPVRFEVVRTPTTVRLRVDGPPQGEAGATLQALVRRDEEAVEGLGALAPEGLVIFRSGTRVLGQAALESGVARLVAGDLKAGRHVLSATFVGDGDYADSASEALDAIVKASTRIRVSSAMPYGREGSLLTFTARVTALDGSTATPGGVVEFFRQGAKAPFARAALSDGKAVVRTDDLRRGDHEVYARYAGATGFYASHSEAIDVRVYFRTVVDLMVVYTRGARTWVGGKDEVRDKIIDAVDALNRALKNSRIEVTVRLVWSQEVDYAQSDAYETDLDRLRDPDDDFMDEVHTLRNRHGADLVSLMVRDTGAGGIIGLAYRMFEKRQSQSHVGFSMVQMSKSAGPDYILAHEIGHNFGASHDDDNLTNGTGLARYSRGFRFNIGKTVYHDIMSYSPGKTILYFSNPRVSYEGHPVGDARTADVARLIGETAPIVASYRKQRVALGKELA